ncbi:MAG: protein kinase domain-containing protein [Dehalococcoidia bacterium]
MADSSFEELAPGSVLNHWVLDEPIGGGAMGMVWRGSDRRDGSRVAIKLLAPQFQADPSFRSRFEREAHLATLLKSPYTVQTHAFGRDRGFYFIVMEYVEGDPVDKLLAKGPIPLDEALEIATDTARALEAAATQRIVHRDLKPSNIIVNPDGAAKLVDFGIAGQTITKDTSGGFAGTVQYAAPEQQKGESDHRTDVYSLGATLFHMLAGRPPYTGRTNREILAQHLHAPFPAALLALQPEPVVDLIRRCMQKDPDDRYQSAAELAGALERVRTRLLQAMATIPPAMPGPVSTTPEPDDDATGTLVLPGSGGSQPAPDATVVFAAGSVGGGSLPPMPRPPAPPAATIASAGALASSGALDAPPTAGTVVSAPAATAPVARAPQPVVAPPAPPAAVPPLAAPKEGGGGGMGKILLFALGGVVAIGVAVGAILALAGGGGDDDTPAVPVASATPTGQGGSATGTASASPSGTASATTTAAASATTASPSPAATTAAPSPTPTTAPPTATPTQVPPTPVPTQATQPPPTATPTRPAQANFSFAGFSGGSNCPSVVTANVSFSNASGQTVSGSWTYNGGPSGIGVQAQTVTGAGTVGFSTFATPPPGTYVFTATVAGAPVASGSITVTCG